MNRKYVIALAVGAVVIALTVLLTSPGRPRRATDPSRYRYMHCPACYREKPYTPAGFDQPCQYCEKSLVPTEQSVGDAGGRSERYGKMAALIGLEVVALMAILVFLARPRPVDPDGEFLYIACENCTQKIRYLERQIGQTAMCPRCKTTFVCPEAEDGA